MVVVVVELVVEQVVAEVVVKIAAVVAVVAGGKLKHVAIRVKFVQEHVLLFETVNIAKDANEFMEADILTKALGAPQHGPKSHSILGYKQLK